MAAKGLLSLYREVGAELLHKRDRGKDAAMGIRAGTIKEQRYGEEIVGGIDGIELLAGYKEQERRRKREAAGLDPDGTEGDSELDEQEAEADWKKWEAESDSDSDEEGWINVESDGEDINISDSEDEKEDKKKKDGPSAAKKAKLAATAEEERPVTHVHSVPVREQRTVPWPGWVGDALLARLRERGVSAPYAHQVEAAQLAHEGRHVVVATGTASGKSLAYQLPALSRLAADPRACVLYLAPTKALARDQLAAVAALADPSVRPAAYDGDTPAEERDWVRRHSRWIVTNPDMLHRGVLPNHARWIRFLRRLSYVVVDECHTYRGVFGSHVALLLRRLRRVAQRYGADPVFVLASATVADPAACVPEVAGCCV